MVRKLKEKHLEKLNLIFGLAVTLFAILFLIFYYLSAILLLFLLATAIIFIGISKLINSFSNKMFPLGLAIYKFIIGFVAILLAIIVISNLIQEPFIQIELLIIILSFLFVLIGFERIAFGFVLQGYPRWYRILLINIGIILILCSIIVFIFIFINYSVAIPLVALSILISGIIRITFGIAKTE